MQAQHGIGTQAAEGTAATQPLSFSVHSMPAARLPEDRRTLRGRLQMLLVLLVCAAPVVASYLAYYVLQPSGRVNYGELIEPLRDLPAAAQLPLLNLQRQPVDPAGLRGQWLLVMVNDGTCGAVCERLMYAQRQVRESLGREKDRTERVWLVTGPAPVRSALLPALAGATVLYAPREAVAAWLTPTAGHDLSEQLYLVDPMGRWMMRFPPEPDMAKVKRDLDRLLRASAAWDTPGR